jgi:rubredoxin
MVAHTYCCGFEDFPEDWICRDCLLLDISESSDDYEEDK